MRSPSCPVPVVPPPSPWAWPPSLKSLSADRTHGLLVPLRHRVRSAVHSHHRRQRHPRRPLSDRRMLANAMRLKKFGDPTWRPQHHHYADRHCVVGHHAVHMLPTPTAASRHGSDSASPTSYLPPPASCCDAARGQDGPRQVRRFRSCRWWDVAVTFTADSRRSSIPRSAISPRAKTGRPRSTPES